LLVEPNLTVYYNSGLEALSPMKVSNFEASDLILVLKQGCVINKIFQVSQIKLDSEINF